MFRLRLFSKVDVSINQGTEFVAEVTVKTQKWTCRKCGVSNFASGFEIVSFTDYGDATNTCGIILIFVMIEPISILIKIGWNQNV
jgi:hypothetical protein